MTVLCRRTRCLLAFVSAPFALRAQQTPAVPPLPTIDAPVHDYRATRSVAVVRHADSVPFSVIMPDSAAGVVFTGIVTHRLGAEVLLVRSGGSRVRQLVFLNDSGRVTSRMEDTALFPMRVTSIVTGPHGTFVLGTGDRWKSFDADHRPIAADSSVRLGMLAQYVGTLGDGSNLVYAPERTDRSFKPAPGGSVVVNTASFIRVGRDGAAQYLPVVSRALSVMSTMPAALSLQVQSSPSGTTIIAPPGAMGVPQIASWPVRPSATTFASDSTIWDFDVMAWRITTYDPSGAARAVALLPIPPANESATLTRQTALSDAVSLQALLDDEGQLWIEPFDTQKATGRVKVRATGSPLWGFAPDGTLIGGMELPKGFRVVQIGKDFLFGLEERDGKVAAVTYRLK